MTFECRLCGQCCMSLGDYITIERQIGPYDFEGCCVSTDTRFHAVIDPDKRDLFADNAWISSHSSACPFLRPSGDRIVCTIHETSPFQCKFYRCRVLIIADRDDHALGWVTGTLSLMSDNPDLRKDWEDTEKNRKAVDLPEEEYFRQSLEKKGYRVRYGPD